MAAARTDMLREVTGTWRPSSPFSLTYEFNPNNIFGLLPLTRCLCVHLRRLACDRAVWGRQTASWPLACESVKARGEVASAPCAREVRARRSGGHLSVLLRSRARNMCGQRPKCKKERKQVRIRIGRNGTLTDKRPQLRERSWCVVCVAIMLSR